MANKRSLKKLINLISEELFAECVAASLYGNDVSKDNADTLLHSVVKLRNDFVSRISHPEPGMPARQYYRKLRESLSIHVGEIADQIDNL